MSHLAGFVFDVYDDTNGDTLRTVIPDAESVPDFVKEAERITPDRAQALPDDAYSLVMIDGGRKLKKYASVDKGNTALSVLYLLKQAHLLPEVAVKIAATNLIEACNRFELDVPEELVKAASTGISGVSGGSQQPYLQKELNKAIEARTTFPTPEPQRESRVNPMLGQGTGKDPDVKKRTNVDSIDTTNYLNTPSGPGGVEETGTAVEKVAHARAVREHGGLVESFGLGDTEVQTKGQNWRVSPYVDMESWEPGADLMKEASAPERTLLGGKYPVDSYDQVKTAAVYFSEGIRKFHPRDRREFCVKLAARMGELLIDVPELIEKYASPGYGADCEAYVNYRRGFVAEEFHPALDLLLEKRAQVGADTYAEALCEFDQMTNLHYDWDAQIPDPWASTFGPSLDKVAADEWVWDTGGVRVDEQDLQNLAVNGFELVKTKFGADFAKEFSKSPKTFFNALPLPNQTVLGRCAMDRHCGTYTE